MPGSSALTAVVLGGLIPAVLFGLSGALQKGATGAGLGLATYLLCVGAGVVAVGAAFWAAMPTEHAATGKGVGLAVALGVCWAGGSGLVAIAILKHGGRIAQLAPLYNTNTLVTVLLGLVVFSEAASLDVPRLVLGALLIIAGSVLAATA